MAAFLSNTNANPPIIKINRTRKIFRIRVNGNNNISISNKITITSDIQSNICIEDRIDCVQMNILIAMPAYQGGVQTSTAKSIVELTTLLNINGIKSKWLTIDSESLITRGRNACIAYFLSAKEFTHILFIDADITFPVAAVLRLLDSNKDITGIAYPKKGLSQKDIVQSVLQTVRWDHVDMAMKRGLSIPSIIDEQMKLIDDNQVFLRATNYVMNPLPGPLAIENGWLKVAEIGTGFMMIKRKVIDDLVQKHPEMKYHNDLPTYNLYHPDMKDNFYLFFDCRVGQCMIDNVKSQRYLSEDYAFCQLCRSIGYDIWLDITQTVAHTGNYIFVGNLLSTLSLRASDMDKYKK